MKRYLVREGTMEALANAIRNKTGTTKKLTPSEMAEKIATIRLYEGDPTLEGIKIVPNGTEIVKVPPVGVDGFGIVTVEGDENLISENIKSGVSIYGVEGTHVGGVDAILETLYVTPTAEETIITPDEGIDGFNEVVIEAVNLQEKEITPTATENIIEPDEDFVGLSTVKILGDDNLIPENIKEGVSIFGIEGALSNYDLPLDSLTVIPSTNAQKIEPDAEHSGFRIVLVAGDVDLVPENVRSGVEIFGVTGTVEESWEFIYGNLAFETAAVFTNSPIIGALEVTE